MSILRAALAALALTAATLAPAAAAPRAPGAAPAAWTIDRADSRISFRARIHGQVVRGVFKRWEAQVALPTPGQAGRLSLTVENGSLVTGDPARDQWLVGPAGLGAAAFKTSSFASSAVSACAGHAPGACPFDDAAQGQWAIRGKRWPATLRLKRVVERKAERVEGEVAAPAAALAGLAPQGLDPASVVIEVRLAKRAP